jgi:hypothetical protein
MPLRSCRSSSYCCGSTDNIPDIPSGSNHPAALAPKGGAGQRGISRVRGGVIPPCESPARVAKTKTNNRMHELQHPLQVHATVAADRVCGDGVTPPAAVANLACACENIHSWISLSGDLVFSHQQGIYGF